MTGRTTSVAAHRFNNDLRYRDDAHPNQRQLTPPYVLEPVREALGGVIELDPCTEPDNPCGALRWFTRTENGLVREWIGETIYVNPPYSKAREPWVRKCIQAARDGSKVILLMPAATDTRIFQEAMSTASEVVFIKGRVKFGVLRENRRQEAASHPSALIGWNVDLMPCAALGLRAMLAMSQRAKTAIGYGEHDGRCDRPAGSTHSKLWCQRCDDMRRETITAQMKAISDLFKVKA